MEINLHALFQTEFHPSPVFPGLCRGFFVQRCARTTGTKCRDQIALLAKAARCAPAYMNDGKGSGFEIQDSMKSEAPSSSHSTLDARRLSLDPRHPTLVTGI